MITLTYILLSVAPMLVCLMACLALLPILVAMHVRRAERPTDEACTLDAWETVEASLRVACSGMRIARAVVRVNRLSYIPSRPKLGKRHASEIAGASWVRPTSGCPPDSVSGCAT